MELKSGSPKDEIDDALEHLETISLSALYQQGKLGRAYVSFAGDYRGQRLDSILRMKKYELDLQLDGRTLSQGDFHAQNGFCFWSITRKWEPIFDFFTAGIRADQPLPSRYVLMPLTRSDAVSAPQEGTDPNDVNPGSTVLDEAFQRKMSSTPPVGSIKKYRIHYKYENTSLAFEDRDYPACFFPEILKVGEKKKQPHTSFIVSSLYKTEELFDDCTKKDPLKAFLHVPTYKVAQDKLWTGENLGCAFSTFSRSTNGAVVATSLNIDNFIPAKGNRPWVVAKIDYPYVVEPICYVRR